MSSRSPETATVKCSLLFDMLTATFVALDAEAFGPPFAMQIIPVGLHGIKAQTMLHVAANTKRMFSPDVCSVTRVIDSTHNPATLNNK